MSKNNTTSSVTLFQSFPVSTKFNSTRLPQVDDTASRSSTPICDYVVAKERDERGWCEVIALDSPYQRKVYFNGDKLTKSVLEIVHVSGHKNGLLICDGRIYSFM